MVAACSSPAPTAATLLCMLLCPEPQDRPADGELGAQEAGEPVWLEAVSVCERRAHAAPDLGQTTAAGLGAGRLQAPGDPSRSGGTAPLAGPRSSAGPEEWEWGHLWSSVPLPHLPQCPSRHQGPRAHTEGPTKLQPWHPGCSPNSRRPPGPTCTHLLLAGAPPPAHRGTWQDTLEFQVNNEYFFSVNMPTYYIGHTYTKQIIHCFSEIQI